MIATTQNTQINNPDLIAYIIARTGTLPQIQLEEGKRHCLGEFPTHVDVERLKAEFYADSRLQAFIEGKRYFFNRCRTLNLEYRSRQS